MWLVFVVFVLWYAGFSDLNNDKVNLNDSIDVQTPSQDFCANYIYCNKSTYSRTFSWNT